MIKWKTILFLLYQKQYTRHQWGGHGEEEAHGQEDGEGQEGKGDTLLINTKLGIENRK